LSYTQKKVLATLFPTLEMYSMSSDASTPAGGALGPRMMGLVPGANTSEMATKHFNAFPLTHVLTIVEQEKLVQVGLSVVLSDELSNALRVVGVLRGNVCG
jgi:hypothetical protein